MAVVDDRNNPRLGSHDMVVGCALLCHRVRSTSVVAGAERFEQGIWAACVVVELIGSG